MFVFILFLYSYEPSDGTIVEYMLIKKFQIEASTFAVADMISYFSIVLASMFFDCFLRKVHISSIIIATNIAAFALIILRNLFITERMQMDTNVFLYTMAFVGSFIGQISFLPFAIIAAKLCPKALEGTVYAFFMAISNFSGIISRELSGIFTNLFEIKNTIMFQKQNMDNFYILCFSLDLIGLVLILFFIKPFTLDSTYENKNETKNGSLEEDSSGSDSEQHTARDHSEAFDCIEDSRTQETHIEI